MERHPNRVNGYRRKRRSCGLCKPHKVGGAHQFSRVERAIRSDYRVTSVGTVGGYQATAFRPAAG